MALDTDDHLAGLEPVTVEPLVVRLTGVAVRFTPNKLRALKAATGKSLSELMSDEVDAMQAIVWRNVTRSGTPITWSEAGDVELDMTAEPPDPTNGATTGRSPGSAGTGE